MSFEKLNSQLRRGVAAKLRGFQRNGAGGVVERNDSMEPWINLLQDFQPFSSEVADTEMDTRQPAAGMGKTLYQPDRTGSFPA